MISHVKIAAGDDGPAQVSAAYRFALAREPTNRERNVAMSFLNRETRRWREAKTFVWPASTPVEQLIGWQQFDGQWNRRDDGGVRVETHPGAKIVREELTFENGTVEADVMLIGESGDAGLILRVTEPKSGVNALSAYNINLRSSSLRLGKHENNYRQLATVKMTIEPGKWHHVKVQLDSGRIRIWLDAAAEPQIDFTDERPLPAGSLGFRTHQAEAAIRNIRLHRSEQTEDIPLEFSSPVPSTTALAPSDRALAELCKLILNLNEFVYVD
jgi:hypothetical protein